MTINGQTTINRARILLQTRAYYFAGSNPILLHSNQTIITLFIRRARRGRPNFPFIFVHLDASPTGQMHPPCLPALDRLPLFQPKWKCHIAGLVELADTQDLGSCAARRGGSTPPVRTKQHILPYERTLS